MICVIEYLPIQKKRGNQYQYDRKGQLVSIDDQVLTYDEKGNLLWQVTGSPVDQVKPGHNSGVRYQYDDR